MKWQNATITKIYIWAGGAMHMQTLTERSMGFKQCHSTGG